ncbi:unnamed protein product [Soboliphyme baturini]|uniref:Metallo-beta-lactamase domain-containing protein n=1 Tax=Soboliphyme baturini TaxID=241478 RepID=A0A3P8GCY5_9BILA|nr:unnamed protein product [Soboliphyme baturini]
MRRRHFVQGCSTSSRKDSFFPSRLGALTCYIVRALACCNLSQRIGTLLLTGFLSTRRAISSMTSSYKRLPIFDAGGTTICVDYFSRQLAEKKRPVLFFLTHAHSDHTTGLSKRWKYPIYCSRVTAKLITYMFQLDNSVVCPLELDVAHVMTSDDNEPGDVMTTVTLTDANHCPGSVMFRFDGAFGRVIVTGDFRFESCSCVPESWISLPFPTREEAQRMSLDILRYRPAKYIYLVMPQTKLGKEELLVAIANSLGERILVSRERMNIARLTGIPDVFTLEESEARIRVLDLKSARSLYNSYMLSSPNVFYVPYSDHCSHAELINFLNLFNSAHSIHLSIQICSVTYLFTRLFFH